MDDLGQLMAFKMAFKLERAAFEAYLDSRKAQQPAAADGANGIGGANGDGGVGGVGGGGGDSEASASADPGLERLRDDPELHMAASYLPVAFEESSMEIGVLCQLSRDDGSSRTLGIWVSALGVRVFADEDAASMPAVTCNIMCDREVLMQMIRGELEATNAITSGMVMVDDLGQLMAFKMAFKLERDAFEAYLYSGSKRGLTML